MIHFLFKFTMDAFVL